MAYSSQSTYINIMIQHQCEYLVLCLMARDYLTILATTCIAERSFSLSVMCYGRPDQCTQHTQNTHKRKQNPHAMFCDDRQLIADLVRRVSMPSHRERTEQGIG